MGAIPQQLLIQIILIMINAFFAATEIAVLSLNSNKLKQLSEEGDKDALRLLILNDNPSNFLSTIQVGITLAGFLGSAFAADSFSVYLVDWIYNGLNFQALPIASLQTLSVIFITLVLSYFTLVFGELVPKRIAMQKSYEIARFASKVVSAISKVMKPIISFLAFSTNTVLRILHLKVEAEEEDVSEEEIRMMVNIGGERGTIDEDEQEWIENIFEFNDSFVKSAMTRVSDVKAIYIKDTKDEILKLIVSSGLSRFPVYDEDMNDIRGVLYVKDFLLNLNASKPKSIKNLLRPAIFVPDNIRTSELFKDLQRKKTHFAVVVDEFGETSGIITLEDLLEELVGNIYDEYDPVESLPIVKLDDNLWRVEGYVEIDDLNEALDIDVDTEEEYDTLGGLVFSQLTTIPSDGSEFDVEVQGLHIHVEKIEDRRIETALVSKLEEE